MKHRWIDAFAVLLPIVIACAAGMLLYVSFSPVEAALGSFAPLATAAVFPLLTGLLTAAYLRGFVLLFPLEAGEYDMDSRSFTIWKHQTMVTHCASHLLGFYCPVFLKTVYYRIMGVRTGRSTVISGHIEDPGYISIGGGALIAFDCIITAHAMVHGKIRFAPVVVEEGATVGPHVIIMPGVRIGAEAVVAAGAVVPAGTVIPSRELWGGLPARKIKDLARPEKTKCVPAPLPASSGRRRILFVCEAISLAHVVRPIVLAQSLDPTVYDVYFAVGARYRHLVRDAGFPSVEIPTVSPDEFYGRAERGKPVYAEEALRTYVRSELSLFEKTAPDLVVGDFRLSLAVSCKCAGIPHVSIVNAHWSPYRTLPYPVPDVTATRTLGRRASSVLAPFLMPAVLRRHTAVHNRIRRDWGLPPVGSLAEAYTQGDSTCYPDIPEIAPTADLPPTHTYIGPLLWEPSVGMPDRQSDLRAGCRRAYVTMGSSGDHALLPVIQNVLDGLGCEVIAPGAGSAPLLPGIQAAAVSDIVICHGGSGTVYQALSQGTPVLGVCSNMDQQLVMQGVEHAGAGRSLLSRGATRRNIRRAVLELLEDPSYAASAERLGAAIAGSDSARAFSDVLIRVAGSGSQGAETDGRREFASATVGGEV